MRGQKCIMIETARVIIGDPSHVLPGDFESDAGDAPKAGYDSCAHRRCYSHQGTFDTGHGRGYVTGTGYGNDVYTLHYTLDDEGYLEEFWFDFLEEEEEEEEDHTDEYDDEWDDDEE